MRKHMIRQTYTQTAAAAAAAPTLAPTLTQDYVKKTEASGKDVEQQLQLSEKRRCGAEEELKLIAGVCGCKSVRVL